MFGLTLTSIYLSIPLSIYVYIVLSLYLTPPDGMTRYPFWNRSNEDHIFFLTTDISLSLSLSLSVYIYIHIYTLR